MIINQYLPPFPANITVAQPGILEVLIDERGLVVSVSMRVPVSPRYDRAAVDAARGWRYQPATLDGVPVFTVFSRAPDSGYVVLIGLNQAELAKGAWTAFAMMLVLSLSFIVLALVLARRISRSVAEPLWSE